MHATTSPAPLGPYLVPRLVVAGTNSGSGKTTLSMALLAAFARKNLRVIPFKCGPDYIDPAFLQAAAGTVCTNLDAWLMPEEALVQGFMRRMEAVAGTPEESFALIEGVMGYFDGLGHSSRCSTAHIAECLDAPVLLVLNAQGLSLSAAAIVQGFANFYGETSGPNPSGPNPSGPNPSGPSPLRLPPLRLTPRIRGVVCNNVSGKAHYELLQNAITEHTGIPCFGYLPKNLPPLPSRQLGLVPAEETHDLPARLEALAGQASQSLDLEGILALARSAPPLRRPERPGPPATNYRQGSGPSSEQGSEQDFGPRAGACSGQGSGPVTLGVAKDKAFSFTYADNLVFLEECGAKLVFFSPLQDEKLPDGLDGLYLCGGFPEVFAKELGGNAPFRQSLQSALENGLPAYAECGGMLYLCASLQTDSGCHAMTDFFPAKARMTPRLQNFGYITLTLQEDCILGTRGDSFPAHEFHYSAIDEDAPAKAARMEKPTGKSWTGGMIKKRVFAMFPHIHFRGAPGAAKTFIRACRDFRAKDSAKNSAENTTGHNPQGIR